MTVNASPDAAAERVQRRDELLQLLYWLAGEGFEADMTLDGIGRFMARPPEEIRLAVEDAIEVGLIERIAAAGSDRFQLTGSGREEGKRRFAEEFSDYLARDAHGGECTDPNCDCHDSPDAAIACRQEQHGGHP